MKTTAAILILIANLWSLTTATPLTGLFDSDTLKGVVNTMQDPPDDGNTIIQPPPR